MHRANVSPGLKKQKFAFCVMLDKCQYFLWTADLETGAKGLEILCLQS